MGQETRCTRCKSANQDATGLCENCGEPVDIARFELRAPPANGITRRSMLELEELIDEMARRSRGPLGQIAAVDEARLYRTARGAAAGLPAEQSELLVWALQARREAARADVGLEKVFAVLDALCGQMDSDVYEAECMAPVEADVIFDPTTHPGLVELVLRIQSTLPRRLVEMEIAIQPPDKLEAVRFDQRSATIRLREREPVDVVFQGEIRQPGPMRLPIRVIPRCRKDSAHTRCVCSLEGTVHWSVQRDPGGTMVVNTQTIRVTQPIDGSVFHPTFMPETRVEGAEEVDSGRARFDLPLGVEARGIRRQFDRDYPWCEKSHPNRGATKSGHFRVRRGEERSLLFVHQDSSLRLGRSASNHIVTRYGMPDRDEDHWSVVSARHASLTWGQGSDCTTLEDLKSVWGTGLVRGGGGVRKLSEERAIMEPGDRILVPTEGGEVKHSCEVEYDERQVLAADGDESKVACVVLTREGESPWAEVVPPYRHLWLPLPGHEATLGNAPWAAIPIPGLDLPVSLRLLRDEGGQVFVSPATHAAVTLNREQARPLTPHVWYQLGPRDRLTCGEVDLTFAMHQTEADGEPNLAACYRTTRAFYSGPPEFKSLIWPLYVDAE